MTRLKHGSKKHKNLVLDPELETVDIKVDEGLEPNEGFDQNYITRSSRMDDVPDTEPF